MLSLRVIAAALLISFSAACGIEPGDQGTAPPPQDIAGETTGEPPAAVQKLTATAGDARVALAWGKAVGADTYQVWRGEKKGSHPDRIASVEAPLFVDASVTNGKSYFYVVRAENEAGAGTDSNEVSAVPEAVGKSSPDALEAPAGLTAVAGDQSVTVQWNAVAGATGYLVRTAASPGGPYTSGFATTLESLELAGLANGQTVYIVVQAINATTVSALSAEISAMPMAAAPLGPTGFTATAGESSVALQWNPLAGASAYIISVAPSPAGPFIDLSTSAATAYTHTGLVAAVVYCYRVSAVVGADRLDSVVVSAAPLFPAIALAATVGNGEIRLDWSPVHGAASYTIAWASSPAGPFAAAATVAATTYTFGSLVNGTAYFYRVIATTGFGVSSAPSNVAAGVPLGDALAGSPVSGDGFVTLQWAAAAGAEFYEIERSTSSGGGYAPLGTASTTVYTDSTVVNGTSYYYVVRGVNAYATSAFTTPMFGLPQVDAPGAPAAVTAVGALAHVALSWNAGSGAAAYEIYRSTVAGSGYALLDTAAASPYVDYDVQRDVTYYYQVVAVNPGGSAASAAVAATPFGALAAPTNVVVNESDSVVVLTWDDLANTQTEWYSIARSATAGGPYAQIATSVTRSYTDTGVTNGATYYYVIYAENVRAGRGAGSVETQATPAPQAPPLAPTGVYTQAGDTAIKFAWTAPDGAPDAYDVYRSQQPLLGFYLVATTTDTSYDDATAVPQTRYFYRVRARNEGGAGAFSRAADGVLPLVQAPSALTVSGNTYGANLHWQAVDPALGFTIYAAADPGGPFDYIASLPASQRMYLYPLAADGPIYFRVDAEYMTQSLSSAVVGLDYTSGEAPDVTAPTLAAPQTSAEGIALAWSAGANDGAYTVYRRNVATGQIDVVAGTDTMTRAFDAAVTAGGAYAYSVVATDRNKYNHSSATSNEQFVVFDWPQAPNRLRVLTIDPHPQLSWSASSPATVYTVYRSEFFNGPFVSVGATAALTLTDVTLPAGQAAFYVVTARSGDHESAPSMLVGVRKMAPWPEPPSGVTATVDSMGVVSVSWLPTPGALTYRLFLEDAINSSVSQFDLSENHWSSVTSREKPLLIRVSVNATGGQSLRSEPVSVYSHATQAPAVPQDVALNAYPDTKVILLTWGEVYGAAGYRVLAAATPAGPFNAVYDGTGTLMMVPIAEQPVYYQVVAYNAAGQSDASVTVSNNTPGWRDEVGMTLTASGADAKVFLNWSQDPWAVGYRVLRSVAGHAQFTAVTETTQPYHWDVTGAAGTTYDYLVVSLRAGGEPGGYSNIASSLWGVGMAPPGAFTLAHRFTPEGVLIEWSEAPGAVSYDVTFQAYDGYAWSAPILARNRALFLYPAGWPDNAAYLEVTVTAINDVGVTTAGPYTVARSMLPGFTATDSGADYIRVAWNYSETGTLQLRRRNEATGQTVALLISPYDTEYYDFNVAPNTVYTYTLSDPSLGSVTDSVQNSTQSDLGAFADVHSSWYGNEVQIAWSSGEHVSTVEITRFDPYLQAFEPVTTTTENSFVDTGVLSPDESLNTFGYAEMYYVLRARGAYGQSGTQMIMVEPTGPLVTAPDWTGVSLNGQEIDGAVKLWWGDVPFTSTFEIFRSEGGGPFISMHAQLHNDFRDEAVPQGVSLRYFVRAYGALDYADSPLFEAFVAEPPPAPEGVYAYSNGVVYVGWLPVDGADFYLIQRTTLQGDVMILDTSGTLFVDGAPTADQYYAVAAYRDGLVGPWSMGVYGSGKDTLGGFQIDAPEVTVSDITLGEVRVAWQPIYGASAYQVTWDCHQPYLGDVYDSAYDVEATSYTVNLPADSACQFTVNAHTVVGPETSATVDHHLADYPLPLAVTGVTGAAYAPDGAVTFGWSWQPLVYLYEILSSPVPGGPYTQLDYANLVNFATTNTDWGVPTYYVVRGISQTGKPGPLSAEIAVTPYRVPATPDLTAIAGNQRARLTWSTVTYEPTTFRVESSANFDGPYTYVTSVTDLTVDIDGLTADTAVFFRVRGDVPMGSGAFSAPQSVTPLNVPAPENLAVAAGNGALRLTWDPPALSDTYNLYRSNTPGGPYLHRVTTHESSWYEKPVTNGVAQYYVVTAGSGLNESHYSAEVSATPTAGSLVCLVNQATGEMAAFDARTEANGPAQYWRNLVNFRNVAQMEFAQDKLYVLHSDADEIDVISHTGTFGPVQAERFIGGPSSLLNAPRAFTLDTEHGELFVLNGDNRVLVFDLQNAANDAPVRQFAMQNAWALIRALQYDEVYDQLVIVTTDGIQLVDRNANGLILPDLVVAGATETIAVGNGRLYMSNLADKVQVFTLDPSLWGGENLLYEISLPQVTWMKVSGSQFLFHGEYLAGMYMHDLEPFADLPGAQQIFIGKFPPATVLPSGMAFADNNQLEVFQIHPGYSSLDSVGALSGANGGVNAPVAVAFDGVGNQLFVIDGGTSVAQIDNTSEASRQPSTSFQIAGGFDNAKGIAVNASTGGVVVADTAAGIVYSFPANLGNELNAIPLHAFWDSTTPLAAPGAITIDAAAGEIYVADADSINVYPLTADGDTAPLRRIAGSNPDFGAGISALALAPAHNELFVSTATPQVHSFWLTDDGDVMAHRTLWGSTPFPGALLGMTYDPSRDEIVVARDGSPDSLAYFHRTDDQDAMPVRTLESSVLADPGALAICR